MNIDVSTDNGTVSIDPTKVKNCCPVGLSKTDVEIHQGDQTTILRVNHSMLHVLQAISACSHEHSIKAPAP